MPVSACLDFQAAVRYSAQQFNAKGQAMTIDTLAAAKALERAGMENGHAEAVAVVVRDATADLATKADLNALEDRLSERLAAHQSKMEERLVAHQSGMEERLAAHQSGMEERLAAHQSGMEERLAVHESRTEERLAVHESRTEERLAAHESKLNERFAAFESRLEAKLANSVNRMLLGNLAIAGLLFAALKLFN